MTFKRILTNTALVALFAGCRRDAIIQDSTATKNAAPDVNARAAYTANPALSPYDNIILSDQPVAFYNNATFNDISGHGHHGVVMNAPGAATLPNGDSTLLFNGINQYVEVSNEDDLSVATTGILTLEAWVRADVLNFPDMEGTGYVNWMGKGESGQHEYVCRIYGQAPTGNDEGRTNRLVGNAYNPAGVSAAGCYYQPSSSDALTAGEWLHYVFVINTMTTSAQHPHGYTKLYIQRKNSNGTLTTYTDQDSLKNLTLSPGTAPFRIGTRNLGSYFKGAIGKVALYNYEIDSTRIVEHGKRLFDYDYMVLSGNPVAYWNTAGTDITGHGHKGILYNTPGVTTMPNGDGSLVFNGTSQYAEVANMPDLSVPATGILALEAWIRPDVLDFEDMSGTGYVHWAGKRENGQCEYVARMYGQNPTGEDTGRLNRISGYAFKLAGDKGAGSYYQAASNWLIQPGEWIHYTLIINAVDISSSYPTGYTKLYIHRKNSSGTIVTFEDKDALINYNVIPQHGTAPFRIGTADKTSYFHGSIGKVAIYNYEPGAAQLLEHAAKLFNP
jgi:hypothetical protein